MMIVYVNFFILKRKCKFEFFIKVVLIIFKNFYFFESFCFKYNLNFERLVLSIFGNYGVDFIFFYIRGLFYVLL